MRGGVWYQGERNAALGKGLLYGEKFSALVNGWRKRWDDEFPFAWVQLPNFKGRGEGWVLVREAQLKTLRLPHTGIA